MLKTLAASLFVLGSCAGAVGLACAQSYPYKQVRIITAEVGGGNDVVARLLAQGLAASSGQQVIVENRPGVIIAVQTIAKAPPDGHTLLSYNNSLWTLPLVQAAPYDFLRDFAPVTMAAMSPNVLAVHPSLPVKTVRDLIVLAKSRPGELNYVSGATGSSAHMAGELFNAMANVNMVRVPYKGAGPGINDLIGGHVQLIFGTTGSVLPHVRSGKLRGLAVTSARPSALLPGLPTIAASGVPGYELIAIYGVFAPAKTPAMLISRLHEEITRVLQTPEAKERFFNLGIEVVGGSPQQLMDAVKADMARVSRVMKGKSGAG